MKRENLWQLTSNFSISRSVKGTVFVTSEQRNRLYVCHGSPGRPQQHARCPQGDEEENVETHHRRAEHHRDYSLPENGNSSRIFK